MLTSLDNPANQTPDWTTLKDIPSGFVAPTAGLLVWVVYINQSAKQGYIKVNDVIVGQGASNDYFETGSVCPVAAGDVITTSGSANNKVIRFVAYK